MYFSALLVFVASIGVSTSAQGQVLQKTIPLDAGHIGADLPPQGRSLFDRLVYQRSEGGQVVLSIPYPFVRLQEYLRQISSSDTGQVNVVVPLGRALNDPVRARPFDPFLFPTTLIGFTQVSDRGRSWSRTTGSPNYPLQNSLFIGHVQSQGMLAVISANPETGRTEYQLVTGYDGVSTPQLTYAPRSMCISCHQNRAAIFTPFPWSETHASPLVSAFVQQGQKLKWERDQKQGRATGDALQAMSLVDGVRLGDSLGAQGAAREFDGAIREFNNRYWQRNFCEAGYQGSEPENAQIKAQSKSIARADCFRAFLELGMVRVLQEGIHFAPFSTMSGPDKLPPGDWFGHNIPNRDLIPETLGIPSSDPRRFNVSPSDPLVQELAGNEEKLIDRPLNPDRGLNQPAEDPRTPRPEKDFGPQLVTFRKMLRDENFIVQSACEAVGLKGCQNPGKVKVLRLSGSLEMASGGRADSWRAPGKFFFETTDLGLSTAVQYWVSDIAGQCKGGRFSDIQCEFNGTSQKHGLDKSQSVEVHLSLNIPPIDPFRDPPSTPPLGKISWKVAGEAKTLSWSIPCRMVGKESDQKLSFGCFAYDPATVRSQVSRYVRKIWPVRELPEGKMPWFVRDFRDIKDPTQRIDLWQFALPERELPPPQLYNASQFNPAKIQIADHRIRRFINACVECHGANGGFEPRFVSGQSEQEIKAALIKIAPRIRVRLRDEVSPMPQSGSKSEKAMFEETGDREKMFKILNELVGS